MLRFSIEREALTLIDVEVPDQTLVFKWGDRVYVERNVELGTPRAVAKDDSEYLASVSTAYIGADFPCFAHPVEHSVYENGGSYWKRDIVRLGIKPEKVSGARLVWGPPPSSSDIDRLAESVKGATSMFLYPQDVITLHLRKEERHGVAPHVDEIGTTVSFVPPFAFTSARFLVPPPHRVSTLVEGEPAPPTLLGDVRTREFSHEWDSVETRTEKFDLGNLGMTKSLI